MMSRHPRPRMKQTSLCSQPKRWWASRMEQQPQLSLQRHPLQSLRAHRPFRRPTNQTQTSASPLLLRLPTAPSRSRRPPVLRASPLRPPAHRGRPLSRHRTARCRRRLPPRLPPRLLAHLLPACQAPPSLPSPRPTAGRAEFPSGCCLSLLPPRRPDLAPLDHRPKSPSRPLRVVIARALQSQEWIVQ